MNETEAIVARVEGEYAWLEVCKPEDCEQCGRAGGCGLSHGNVRQQRINNSIGARVGDRVVLSVPAGAVLKASFFSYLLPLILGLAGAALGSIAGGDVVALLGLAAGLLIGIGMLRRINGRFAGTGGSMLAMRIKSPVVQLHRNHEI